MSLESKEPILKVESPQNATPFRGNIDETRARLDAKLQAFVRNNLYEDLSDEEKTLLEKCKLTLRDWDEDKIGAQSGLGITGKTEEGQIDVGIHRGKEGSIRYEGSINKVSISEENARVIFEKYKKIARLQTEVGNTTRTVFNSGELAHQRKDENIEMYRTAVTDKLLAANIKEIAGEISLKQPNGTQQDIMKEGLILGHHVTMSHTKDGNKFSFYIDGLSVRDPEKAQALFEKFYSF